MTTQVKAIRSFSSSIKVIGGRMEGDVFDLEDRVLAEDLCGQGLVEIVGEVPNEEGSSQGGALEQLVSSSPVGQVSAVTSTNTSAKPTTKPVNKPQPAAKKPNSGRSR